MDQDKKEDKMKFCPCCGNESLYKDKKFAQGVVSCSKCEARFYMINTTKPKVTPINE